MALGGSMRLAKRYRTPRLIATGAAALGVWAFVMNRWIINWVESDLKHFATVTSGVALGALAVVPIWRRWRGPWALVALALIACFTLGELHRAWLRHRYAVEEAGGASFELFHPVTTTDLVVRHFTLPLHGLGMARLRVLALTDLHVTEALPAAYYEHVKRSIHDQDPDLVVYTGDYLSRIQRLPLLEAFLADVPRGRLGTFAVLGNHDYWLEDERVAQAFARAGIPLLSGTCHVVPVAGTPGVRLCGSEAPWGPALSRAAIARSAPGTTPLIVLTHTPDNVYDLAELGAALVFAGHTHGGQWRLPLLGSFLIPSRYGRRFDLGHFKVENTDLFVSAGVGSDQPPLRLYCDPELVVVDVTDKR
jgi:predicted MPP superfamily phosphohydrolase